MIPSISRTKIHDKKVKLSHRETDGKGEEYFKYHRQTEVRT